MHALEPKQGCSLNRQIRMLADKSNTRDRYLSIALCYLLSYQAILLFINYITNFLLFGEEGSALDTILVLVPLMVAFLVLTVAFFMSRDVYSYALFAFLSVSYVVSYILFPQNREFMFTSVSDVLNNPIYLLFIYNFLGFSAVRSIDKASVLEDTLEKFSIISILLATSHFLIPSGFKAVYMVFSYSILLHTVFMSLRFIRDGGILRLIFALLGIFMIFMGGGRGPLVICLAVPFVYFFHCGRAKMRVKAILLMIIAVLALVIALTPILGKISNSLGGESRSLDMILSGSFFVSSERIGVFQRIIDSIGVAGRGLYGDRLVSTHGYAHNFFLEILVQYGLVLGVPIILVILYILLRELTQKEDKFHLLSYAFISTGFLKLMVSGSYLNQETAFYVLLGFCIRFIHKRKIV